MPIDIFILDIHLPDGSGLDFLFEVSMLHPTARAIVLTSSTLPEHEVQAIALGVIHFLKKPMVPTVLIGYLGDLLGFTDADPGESFRGTLKDLTPLDLIQLKCLTQANTVMELTSASQIGRLHFREGNIVHAETNEEAGVPALRSIFSWRRGFVRELPIDSGVADTITSPWQSLLMELAHELDQQK
jgi:DNA-binding response OmpR family regulator